MSQCRTTFIKFIAFTILAAAVTYAGEKWYTIAVDEMYVADFTLNSGNKKVITIETSKKETVLFRVELHDGDFYKVGKGPYPINMKNMGSEMSLSSFYGGFECNPIDGKIQLEFSNKDNTPYKVLVIRKKQ